MKRINKENLYQSLEKGIENLFFVAQKYCWNEISENYVFITTNINDIQEDNFFKQRKKRKSQNDLKTPQNLLSVVNELLRIFDKIYDINLYIYKANKNNTIIEIQYILIKDTGNTNYEIKNPMLHTKIPFPPYAKNRKFDINWEHGGLRHEMNMLLGKIKLFLH